jgi:Tfp pilus assembly protein PilW
MEGTARGRERRAIEECLSRSQRGRDVLAILTQALADVGQEAAEEAPAGGLVRLVLLVTRDALQFLRGDLQPVAVAGVGVVRGAAAGAPTYCEFSTSMGDLGVAVALDRAVARVDARMVLMSRSGPVNDARVSLSRDGRPIISVPCEQDGSLSFGIPPDGCYLVEVRRQGHVVGRFALDLIPQA